MSGELVPVEVVEAELVLPDEQTDRDRHLSDDTLDDLARSTSPHTERAYDRCWNAALAWCNGQGRTALPMSPETLAEYVTHLTRTPSPTTGRPYAPSSIDQAISSIRVAHQRAGHESEPHTKLALKVLKVYRRDRAKDGWRSKQAPPITLDLLRLMLRTCDQSTAVGQRDAVILVLGYGMMGRRSELSALRVEHTAVSADWVSTYVAMSKTDQSAHGEETDIPRALAPDIDVVAVVSRWLQTLAEHGIAEGPLIRRIHRSGAIHGGLSGDSINTRTRAVAQQAGLIDADRVTAHGLRAGGPTDAAERGVAPVFIARHGRWSEKSTQVLTYIRPSDKRRNNPLLGGGTAR